VPLPEIAGAIGAGCGCLRADHARAGAGLLRQLARLAMLEVPASGAATQRQLDWVLTGPDLVTNLRESDYDAT